MGNGKSEVHQVWLPLRIALGLTDNSSSTDTTDTDTV